MKRKMVALALSVILCLVSVTAQAGEMISITLSKNALLEHEVCEAEMHIQPEGKVRVTRHSLWPWDEQGEKWSMFVEIENTSDERIIVDENWLIAHNSKSVEEERAHQIFECSTNRFDPGERIVLHIGSYPYVKEKRNDADRKNDIWDVEGMEDFARSINEAANLCILLDTRGEESPQKWPAKDIEPRIWIDERALHFEWPNASDDVVFRTIGAVMTDETGKIIDVIRSSATMGAAAQTGETLLFEKELPPYVTKEMIDGAGFEPFAFTIPSSAENAEYFRKNR